MDMTLRGKRPRRLMTGTDGRSSSNMAMTFTASRRLGGGGGGSCFAGASRGGKTMNGKPFGGVNAVVCLASVAFAMMAPTPIGVEPANLPAKRGWQTVQGWRTGSRNRHTLAGVPTRPAIKRAMRAACHACSKTHTDMKKPRPKRIGRGCCAYSSPGRQARPPDATGVRHIKQLRLARQVARLPNARCGNAQRPPCEW